MPRALTAYLARLATETARLLLLLAVSYAWAAPAHLGTQYVHDPRIALHPPLLEALRSVDTLLMFAAPILAVTGVVIVGVLTRDAARLDGVSPIAPFILLFGYVGMQGALSQFRWAQPFITFQAQAVALALIGTLFTVAVVSRRNVIAALAWGIVSGGVIVALQLLSKPVTIMDPDVESGLRAAVAWGITWLSVLGSTLAVYVGQAARGRCPL